MHIPELVKEEILRFDPKAEVILFGSRARGTARPDSDWDFLVLLDMPELPRGLKRAIRDRLYEIELENNGIISTIIHTRHEWARREVTPLFQIISKEGMAA